MKMKFLKNNTKILKDCRTVKIVSSAEIIKAKYKNKCLDSGKLPDDLINNNKTKRFKRSKDNQCAENTCAEVNVQNGKSASNNSQVKSSAPTSANSSDTNDDYLFTINRISHEIKIGNDRPFYFGVRSYLHNFYDPPDKDVMNSGEFLQEDFLIERTKQKRGCCLQTLLWIGINLSIIGAIILLVGFLVPFRNTIVGSHENLQIFDRYAIAFNHYLHLCRFVGFVLITLGLIVAVIILFISKKYDKSEPTSYYVLGATILPETFVANPLAGAQRHTANGVAGASRNMSKSK